MAKERRGGQKSQKIDDIFHKRPLKTRLESKNVLARLRTGLSFSIQPPPLCKNYDTVRISTTPLKCQLDMDLCETNAE